METYIGFTGTGCDVEFDHVRETEKAYLVRTMDGQEIWLPKSAFEDDGCLTTYGVTLFYRKMNEER